MSARKIFVLPCLVLLALATPLAGRPESTPLGANADSANPAADPLFKEPYIDVDEWRDAPVRHRYIHGGFKGTEMRFSFYFPPKEQFQGRFFQYVTPVPDSENLAQSVLAGDNNVGFAAASGAYFVETNGGGKSATAGPAFGADPTIGGYRANAAAARYSRAVAASIYGRRRVFGYIYGGSGGAYRTMGSMEHTSGVWDGAVPFVIGTPMASPNNFSIRMHAMRILKDKFPLIVDAMDAGGRYARPHAPADRNVRSILNFIPMLTEEQEREHSEERALRDTLDRVNQLGMKVAMK